MGKSSETENFDYGAIFGPVYQQMQAQRAPVQAPPPVSLAAPQASSLFLGTIPQQIHGGRKSMVVGRIVVGGSTNSGKKGAGTTGEEAASSTQRSPAQQPEVATSLPAQTPAAPANPAAEPTHLWVILRKERSNTTGAHQITGVIGSYYTAYEASCNALKYVEEHWPETYRMRDIVQLDAAEDMDAITEPGVCYNEPGGERMVIRVNSGWKWVKVWTQMLVLL